jgi:hypothetical protein
MQNQQQNNSPIKKFLRTHNYGITSIMDICKITKEEIAEFATGMVEKLEPNLFYAFLCQLATFIPTCPILVFSPEYSYIMKDNGEYELNTECAGNKEDYSIALIPVKITEYYGIAIFEKGACIHYYDPLYNDITSATRQYLRTLIQGLVDDDSIVKVYQTKHILFNKATTNNEATIICCIIAERFLMHSKRTYIDNFNINQERDNVVTRVLETIITGKKYPVEGTSDAEGSYKSYQMRRMREEESIEECAERLRSENVKRRFSRQKETDDEKDIRRFSDRIRYQTSTDRRRNTIYLQGRQTNDDLPDHRLNPMDTVCTHCGALHFYEEATSKSKN